MYLQTVTKTVQCTQKNETKNEKNPLVFVQKNNPGIRHLKRKLTDYWHILTKEHEYI